MCNQKKSQAKQYKKKLLNEQQKQVIPIFYVKNYIIYQVYCYNYKDKYKWFDYI